ncbi:MAG: alpha/beta hydrolase [Candidatus Moranbacteria bacterium]|nr:alpha/beta hydrolase [Candidatus Moranbacteria bacterium]
MNKKTQVLIVHGGMTFRNKRDYLEYLKTREIDIEKITKWTDDFLEKSLGGNFEIIKPRMPLGENAKYEEWKIHFERHFPFLENGIILIGISLGGTFLARYLSENKFPKKILSTYLIAPPYDDTLIGEDLAGGFRLQSDLSLLGKSSGKLYLMFSKDDDVVPASHAEKYRKKLKNAEIILYESKNGHFKIPEFPEIVELIKNDANK